MSSQSPVVGIVCIEISRKIAEVWPEKESYIAASYSKFVEDGGAQCIPIWINKPEKYYRDVLKKINGVLIPGGAVNYYSKDNVSPDTNYCVESVNIILRLAREMFDHGIHFPVWGTCLGFQLMINHSAGETDIRKKCCQLKESMPLELENDFRDSKMFADVSEDMEKNFRTEKFAYHFHHYYITQEALKSFGINNQWTVTGVTDVNDVTDLKRVKSISVIEHKKYPFYGVQFHPEKTLHETASPNLSKTETSKSCAQHFAKFFVSECRKNSNHFDDENEAQRHLISKFPVTETTGTLWKECYLFKKNMDYPEA